MLDCKGLFSDSSGRNVVAEDDEDDEEEEDDEIKCLEEEDDDINAEDVADPGTIDDIDMGANELLELTIECLILSPRGNA